MNEGHIPLKRKAPLLIAFLAIGMALGWGVSLVFRGPQPPPGEGHAHALWHCSMDPDVRRDGPGTCPRCGMDLVPLEADHEESSAGDWALTLSGNARQLAGIELARVERRPLSQEIELFGKIVYKSETTTEVTALIAGQIETLFAKFPGTAVEKGAPLISLFSPDMLTGQRIYLEATEAMGARPIEIRSASSLRLLAAREKLISWGLTEAEIEAIKQRNSPADRHVITAPVSGTLLARHLNEGDYVRAGDKLFTLADLSRVWLELSVYEPDLAWLRPGQNTEFEVEAYPGERFRGRIAFVDMAINTQTRTLRVLADVENPGTKLKHEMFARAIVRAQIGGPAAGIPNDGPGPSARATRRWVDPIHREVRSDKPGTCPRCGLPLVPLDSVEPFATEPPLTIPASAPLLTGKRAIVYVVDPNAPNTFLGREVELGARVGDVVVVVGGLSEGEMVVARGAFKIDSELQIRGRKSLMYSQESGPGSANPAIAKAAFVNEPDSSAYPRFSAALSTALDGYFQLARFLSQDDLRGAVATSANLAKRLEDIARLDLDEAQVAAWEVNRGEMIRVCRRIAAAESLAAARPGFKFLSDLIGRVLTRFGWAGEAPILRFHCPMAFENTGADWFQSQAEIENPYFGATMLRCGSPVPLTGEGEWTPTADQQP